MNNKLTEIVSNRANEENLSQELANDIINIFKRNTGKTKADTINKQKQIKLKIKDYLDSNDI